MSARRSVALAALLLAACGNGREGAAEAPDPAPPTRTVPPPELEERQLHDWRLSLPAAWWEDARPYQSHGVLFFGPKDDEFQPSVQMWLRPWKGTVEELFRVERGRRDLPGGTVEILEEGRDTVAGLPARFLVYLQQERDPRTKRMRDFLTIDWYFVKDRLGWILRGVSTARTFHSKYRPLFTAVKGRLRYSPP